MSSGRGPEYVVKSREIELKGRFGEVIHVNLERWIDTRLMGGDLKWADWKNRTEIEGLNASNSVNNPYQPLTPFLPPGSSECIEGWRGLSPLVLNPNFGTAPGISLPDQLSTQWTHFGDAINVYGVAADGFAANTWDNWKTPRKIRHISAMTMHDSTSDCPALWLVPAGLTGRLGIEILQLL